MLATPFLHSWKSLHTVQIFFATSPQKTHICTTSHTQKQLNKKEVYCRLYSTWLCTLNNFFLNCYTLIKNKIKFSTYKRKFRRDRVQSHIWLTAFPYMTKYLCIFPYIGSPSSYMTLHPIHSEFPYISGNFFFLFYQCTCCISALLSTWNLENCTFYSAHLL